MKCQYLLLVTGLLLSSCATPISQTNEASVPSETPTDLPTPTYTNVPTSTNIPSPTSTTKPKPTVQEVLAPTATATPSCENKAEFVDFLSMSNNVILEPGVYFTQVWRIRNTGTCTWNTDYQFVFEDGNQMNSPDTTSLSEEVLPDQTIDISLLLQTPMEANSYTSNWMLKSSTGELFGNGDDLKQPFSLAIIVKEFKPDKVYACKYG
jgi:hypothetical protein